MKAFVDDLIDNRLIITLVLEVFLDFHRTGEGAAREPSVFTASGLSRSSLMRCKINKNLWAQGS